MMKAGVLTGRGMVPSRWTYFFSYFLLYFALFLCIGWGSRADRLFLVQCASATLTVLDIFFYLAQRTNRSTMGDKKNVTKNPFTKGNNNKKVIVAGRINTPSRFALYMDEATQSKYRAQMSLLCLSSVKFFHRLAEITNQKFPFHLRPPSLRWRRKTIKALET